MQSRGRQDPGGGAREHFSFLAPGSWLLGTSNSCTNTAGKAVFQRAVPGSGSFQGHRKGQQTLGRVVGNKD